jgi:uncharacterized membrane protein YphA (DoxX/SURF4 family)
VGLHLRNVPTRAATGAFILHSGLNKWNGSEEQAKGLHAFATGAYPFLAKIPPTTFLKALATAEIGLGGALLTPLISNRLAGTVLTAFSGSLLGIYLRTPALHKEGSILPNEAGTAISKDVWMLGIGLGLLAEGTEQGPKGRDAA